MPSLHHAASHNELLDTEDTYTEYGARPLATKPGVTIYRTTLYQHRHKKFRCKMARTKNADKPTKSKTQVGTTKRRRKKNEKAEEVKISKPYIPPPPRPRARVLSEQEEMELAVQSISIEAPPPPTATFVPGSAIIDSTVSANRDDVSVRDDGTPIVVRPSSNRENELLSSNVNIPNIPMLHSSNKMEVNQGVSVEYSKNSMTNESYNSQSAHKINSPTNSNAQTSTPTISNVFSLSEAVKNQSEYFQERIHSSVSPVPVQNTVSDQSCLKTSVSSMSCSQTKTGTHSSRTVPIVKGTMSENMQRTEQFNIIHRKSINYNRPTVPTIPSQPSTTGSLKQSPVSKHTEDSMSSRRSDRSSSSGSSDDLSMKGKHWKKTRHMQSPAVTPSTSPVVSAPPTSHATSNVSVTFQPYLSQVITTMQAPSYQAMSHPNSQSGLNQTKAQSSDRTTAVAHGLHSNQLLDASPSTYHKVLQQDLYQTSRQVTNTEARSGSINLGSVGHVPSTQTTNAPYNQDVSPQISINHGTSQSKMTQPGSSAPQSIGHLSINNIPQNKNLLQNRPYHPYGASVNSPVTTQNTIATYPANPHVSSYRNDNSQQSNTTTRNPSVTANVANTTTPARDPNAIYPQTPSYSTPSIQHNRQASTHYATPTTMHHAAAIGTPSSIATASATIPPHIDDKTKDCVAALLIHKQRNQPNLNQLSQAEMLVSKHDAYTKNINVTSHNRGNYVPTSSQIQDNYAQNSVQDASLNAKKGADKYSQFVIGSVISPPKAQPTTQYQQTASNNRYLLNQYYTLTSPHSSEVVKNLAKPVSYPPADTKAYTAQRMPNPAQFTSSHRPHTQTNPPVQPIPTTAQKTRLSNVGTQGPPILPIVNPANIPPDQFMHQFRLPFQNALRHCPPNMQHMMAQYMYSQLSAATTIQQQQQSHIQQYQNTANPVSGSHLAAATANSQQNVSDPLQTISTQQQLAGHRFMNNYPLTHPSAVQARCPPGQRSVNALATHHPPTSIRVPLAISSSGPTGPPLEQFKVLNTNTNLAQVASQMKPNVPSTPRMSQFSVKHTPPQNVGSNPTMPPLMRLDEIEKTGHNTREVAQHGGVHQQLANTSNEFVDMQSYYGSKQSSGNPVGAMNQSHTTSETTKAAMAATLFTPSIVQQMSAEKLKRAQMTKTEELAKEQIISNIVNAQHIARTSRSQARIYKGTDGTKRGKGTGRGRGRGRGKSAPPISELNQPTTTEYHQTSVTSPLLTAPISMANESIVSPNFTAKANTHSITPPVVPITPHTSIGTSSNTSQYVVPGAINVSTVSTNLSSTTSPHTATVSSPSTFVPSTLSTYLPNSINESQTIATTVSINAMTSSVSNPPSMSVNLTQDIRPVNTGVTVPVSNNASKTPESPSFDNANVISIYNNPNCITTLAFVPDRKETFQTISPRTHVPCTSSISRTVPETTSPSVDKFKSIQQPPMTSSIHLPSSTGTGVQTTTLTSTSTCMTSSATAVRTVITHVTPSSIACTTTNPCVTSNSTAVTNVDSHTTKRPATCADVTEENVLSLTDKAGGGVNIEISTLKVNPKTHTILQEVNTTNTYKQFDVRNVTPSINNNRGSATNKILNSEPTSLHLPLAKAALCHTPTNVTDYRASLVKEVKSKESQATQVKAFIDKSRPASGLENQNFAENKRTQHEYSEVTVVNTADAADKANVQIDAVQEVVIDTGLKLNVASNCETILDPLTGELRSVAPTSESKPNVISKDTMMLNPVSPTRHLEPLAGNPLSLAGHSVTPSKHPLSPAGHPVASEENPVTAMGHYLSPQKHPVSPVNHPVAPTTPPVSPARHPTSPESNILHTPPRQTKTKATARKSLAKFRATKPTRRLSTEDSPFGSQITCIQHMDMEKPKFVSEEKKEDVKDVESGNSNTVFTPKPSRRGRGRRFGAKRKLSVDKLQIETQVSSSSRCKPKKPRRSAVQILKDELAEKEREMKILSKRHGSPLFRADSGDNSVRKKLKLSRDAGNITTVKTKRKTEKRPETPDVYKFESSSDELSNDTHNSPDKENKTSTRRVDVTETRNILSESSESVQIHNESGPENPLETNTKTCIETMSGSPKASPTRQKRRRRPKLKPILNEFGFVPSIADQVKTKARRCTNVTYFYKLRTWQKSTMKSHQRRRLQDCAFNRQNSHNSDYVDNDSIADLDSDFKENVPQYFNNKDRFIPKVVKLNSSGFANVLIPKCYVELVRIDLNKITKRLKRKRFNKLHLSNIDNRNATNTISNHQIIKVHDKESPFRHKIINTTKRTELTSETADNKSNQTDMFSESAANKSNQTDTNSEAANMSHKTASVNLPDNGIDINFDSNDEYGVQKRSDQAGSRLKLVFTKVRSVDDTEHKDNVDKNVQKENNEVEKGQPEDENSRHTRETTQAVPVTDSSPEHAVPVTDSSPEHAVPITESSPVTSVNTSVVKRMENVKVIIDNSEPQDNNIISATETNEVIHTKEERHLSDTSAMSKKNDIKETISHNSNTSAISSNKQQSDDTASLKLSQMFSVSPKVKLNLKPVVRIQRLKSNDIRHLKAPKTNGGASKQASGTGHVIVDATRHVKSILPNSDNIKSTPELQTPEEIPKLTKPDVAEPLTEHHNIIQTDQNEFEVLEIKTLPENDSTNIPSDPTNPKSTTLDGMINVPFELKSPRSTIFEEKNEVLDSKHTHSSEIPSCTTASRVESAPQGSSPVTIKHTPSEITDQSHSLSTETAVNQDPLSASDPAISTTAKAALPAQPPEQDPGIAIADLKYDSDADDGYGSPPPLSPAPTPSYSPAYLNNASYKSFKYQNILQPRVVIKRIDQERHFTDFLKGSEIKDDVLDNSIKSEIQLWPDGKVVMRNADEKTDSDGRVSKKADDCEKVAYNVTEKNVPIVETLKQERIDFCENFENCEARNVISSFSTTASNNNDNVIQQSESEEDQTGEQGLIEKNDTEDTQGISINDLAVDEQGGSNTADTLEPQVASSKAVTVVEQDDCSKDDTVEPQGVSNVVTVDAQVVSNKGVTLDPQDVQSEDVTGKQECVTSKDATVEPKLTSADDIAKDSSVLQTSIFTKENIENQNISIKTPCSKAESEDVKGRAVTPTSKNTEVSSIEPKNIEKSSLEPSNETSDEVMKRTVTCINIPTALSINTVNPSSVSLNARNAPSELVSTDQLTASKTPVLPLSTTQSVEQIITQDIESRLTENRSNIAQDNLIPVKPTGEAPVIESPYNVVVPGSSHALTTSQSSHLEEVVKSNLQIVSDTVKSVQEETYRVLSPKPVNTSASSTKTEASSASTKTDSDSTNMCTVNSVTNSVQHRTIDSRRQYLPKTTNRSESMSMVVPLQTTDIVPYKITNVSPIRKNDSPKQKLPEHMDCLSNDFSNQPIPNPAIVPSPVSVPVAIPIRAAASPRQHTLDDAELLLKLKYSHLARNCPPVQPPPTQPFTKSTQGKPKSAKKSSSPKSTHSSSKTTNTYKPSPLSFKSHKSKTQSVLADPNLNKKSPIVPHTVAPFEKKPTPLLRSPDDQQTKSPRVIGRVQPVEKKTNTPEPQKVEQLGVVPTENLLAELRERQDVKMCDCGLIFLDLPHYMIHYNAHSHDGRKTCGQCGHQNGDWISFYTHLYQNHATKS